MLLSLPRTTTTANPHPCPILYPTMTIQPPFDIHPLFLTMGNLIVVAVFTGECWNGLESAGGRVGWRLGCQQPTMRMPHLSLQLLKDSWMACWMHQQLWLFKHLGTHHCPPLTLPTSGSSTPSSPLPHPETRHLPLLCYMVSIFIDSPRCHTAQHGSGHIFFDFLALRITCVDLIIPILCVSLV